MGLFNWEKVDRSDETYKACLGVATGAGAIVGAATGAAAGGVGAPAGFAAGAFWGFAAGYLACPYLAPRIKQKMQLGELMTHAEVEMAAEAMGRFARVSTQAEALKLVALVKGCQPRDDLPSCIDPRLAANRLLAS